jgi:hypothetical protein
LWLKRKSLSAFKKSSKFSITCRNSLTYRTQFFALA